MPANYRVVIEVLDGYVVSVRAALPYGIKTEVVIIDHNNKMVDRSESLVDKREDVAREIVDLIRDQNYIEVGRGKEERL
jgi:AmiR/NasT family two-component response regulator